jgi:hypothetical protein
MRRHRRNNRPAVASPTSPQGDLTGVCRPGRDGQAGCVHGEIEWLEADGVAAAEDETLDLGRAWSASSRVARAIHWPLPRPRPGRVTLAPLALVVVLTFGPFGPGSTNTGDGAVTHEPLTWTCTASKPAATADAALAAHNLRGSLLIEQVQRPPHHPVCVSVIRPRLP